MAGCDVVAKYNSADVHMVPAVTHGKTDDVPDSIVREVMISDENRVTGVRYLDRTHKAEGEVRGRMRRGRVRLRAERGSAADVEVAAVSEGLANSSGQLGKNFIPHMTGGISASSLTDR